MRARYNRNQSACARLCGGKPALLVIVTENRNSGQISLDSPVNQLSRRSAEACRLIKNKKESELNLIERGFYTFGLPSGVTNLFAVNLSVGEKNGDRSACLVGFTKAEHLWQ
jgi:hypothetical protein